MLAQGSRHTPCAARVRITKRRTGRGFTLIEMLIAMVLTLIMVWAIAEFYARVGEAVKDGRAMIDQRGGLRTVTQRLHEDLSLHTAVPAPPVQDSLTPGYSLAGPGYLETFEGGASDADPDGDFVVDSDADGEPDIAELGTNQVPAFIETTLVPNLIGDVDDYLGLTIRSASEPFVASHVRPVPYLPVNAATDDTGVIDLNAAGLPVTVGGTSQVGEVAWWTSFRDDPLFAAGLGTAQLSEARSLHRRLLLVRPELNEVHDADANYSGPYFFRVPNTAPFADYYSIMQLSDVSVRPIGTVNNFVYYFANSLADLTRRENRFLHVQGGPTAFPNALDLLPSNGGNSALPRMHVANNFTQYRWVLGGARRGEDVILSNVLAFDLRLFDATAVLRGNNPVAANVTGTLQPGDPGYKLAVDSNYPIAGQGAYVDLWYNRYVQPVVPANSVSVFSGGPNAKSQLLGAVYCTWAASYERDGFDQDSNGTLDQGTDGIDSDTFNGVDDMVGEYETSPPYPVRLRGLEVKVRTYEPGTRQVQQGTVSSDFIPE